MKRNEAFFHTVPLRDQAALLASPTYHQSDGLPIPCHDVYRDGRPRAIFRQVMLPKFIPATCQIIFSSHGICRTLKRMWHHNLGIWHPPLLHLHHHRLGKEGKCAGLLGSSRHPAVFPLCLLVPILDARDL